MRTLISVCDSALRAPATLVLTRHNEMRVGAKLHQTCPSIMGRWWPCESVSHRSLAAASSVVSVFTRHCQHYHLSLFYPDPILPQLFSLPCPLPSGALFRPNTHPFPFLLPLWAIWAKFCLSSIRINLESVLSKLVLQYHNLKFQYNNPLLDHFNPIIAPQTDYGG